MTPAATAAESEVSDSTRQQLCCGPNVTCWRPDVWLLFLSFVLLYLNAKEQLEISTSRFTRRLTVISLGVIIVNIVLYDLLFNYITDGICSKKINK